MPYLRRLLAVLFVVLLSSATAQAAPYQRLYAFGASYSDIGAGHLFSNGATAVSHLAQRMGIPFTHSQDPAASHQGIDFAVAAAGTGADPGRRRNGVLLGVGMVNQAQDFAARVRAKQIQFDPDTALFFIAGGMNDEGPAEGSVANITRIIEILNDAGARHIRLALLPTRIPAYSEPGLRLNPAYRNLVPALRAKLGIDLQLSDWGLYFDEVLQHPARHGLSNTTTHCAGRAFFGEEAAPCANPDSYFYYYVNHPSSVVHRIVGDKLYAEIRKQEDGGN